MKKLLFVATLAVVSSVGACGLGPALAMSDLLDRDDMLTRRANRLLKTATMADLGVVSKCNEDLGNMRESLKFANDVLAQTGKKAFLIPFFGGIVSAKHLSALLRANKTYQRQLLNLPGDLEAEEVALKAVSELLK